MQWLAYAGAQIAVPVGHTPNCYDYLFVTVGDGRRWFIPARRLGGAQQLTLGGPKYAMYEVERGVPMPLSDSSQRAV